MNHRKFILLDGLRGMAALFVFTLHTPTYWMLAPGKGYLAVDLFFLLSGFVIAYAYEDKIRKGLVSRPTFIAIRLVRLYPVFLLSLLLSAALAIARARLGHHADLLTVPEVLRVTASNLFLLPSTVPESDSLFPLNGLYWTLFFELVVNIIYVTLFPLLTTRRLLAVVLVSSMSILASAVTTGHLNIGFTTDIHSLIAGFSRALFGILAGVILFRKKEVFLRFFAIQKKIPRAAPAVAFGLCAVMLMVPQIQHGNGLVDAVIVLVVFPILILHMIDGQAGYLTSVMLFLGAASYPMYVLQAPVASLVGFIVGLDKVQRYAPFSGIVLELVMVCGCAWLERHLDEPLRRWFSKRYVTSPVKIPDDTEKIA